MMIRMLGVCGTVLLGVASVSADSGRSPDRDGQMTEPSAAATEKKRKEWQAKLDILQLQAAIQAILEQQKAKAPTGIIELPTPSPNKPRS